MRLISLVLAPLLLPCLLGLSVLPPSSPVLPLLLPHTPLYLPHYTQSLTFQPRVIPCAHCSVNDCDNNFWCASYRPTVCSSESYCDSCSCVTSLGCRARCQRCQGSSPPSPPSPSPSPSSCRASGGPAKDRECIFPFIYQGVTYHGCAQLYGGLSNVYSQVNPVYWCSTKVDGNRYHIRGPYTNPGKYVGYCDATCPKVKFII